MVRGPVIVVGGGHAGIEAAFSCCRLGVEVILFTVSLDNIGKLSCNPAIGGVAKSHLVRELDALGGLQGVLADKSSMQFRVLNRSKGMAVRATRAQVDRMLYARLGREALLSVPNLKILEAEAYSIITKNGKVAGIRTSLGDFKAKAVILACGTFLDATIHIGFTNFKQGRMGEPASIKLFESIRGLGFSVRHFKTGTCARLDGRTIDYGLMLEQKPDKDFMPFSFFTDFKPKNTRSCFITYTNQKTHRIINKGLKFSPLYQGVIKSTGVRYCPSLEDKVVKFSSKDRHQVFIEPESEELVDVYPNGVSTSLPFDVQYRFIHSIEGLRRAVILRPGYGIEHGLIDARQLKGTLEAKDIKGLFFAGQINGTTGYEEAAAQGIIAGVNAALGLLKKPPFVLSRQESFIGVLIDELTKKGVDEPFRMFTSRSELKLTLREDNAILRLYKKGYNLGLLDKEKYKRVKSVENNIAGFIKKAKREKISLNSLSGGLRFLRAGKNKSVNVFDLLKRPRVSVDKLKEYVTFLAGISLYEKMELEIEAKYEGFIKRELTNLKDLLRLDRIKIPAKMKYASLAGLSGEAVEKLEYYSPATLKEALDIPGITPAAVMIVLSYINRQNAKKKDKKYR